MTRSPPIMRLRIIALVEGCKSLTCNRRCSRGRDMALLVGKALNRHRQKSSCGAAVRYHSAKLVV